MSAETSMPDAIQKAFASGEFTRAVRLWEAYAEKVREAVRTHTAGESTLAEMRTLIDQARLEVLSFRAHAADRLGGARAAAAYEAVPAPIPGSLRTRA